MWWKRNVDLTGIVYFSGALPPTLESLRGLTAAGVEVAPGSARDDAHWTARLRHPVWGEAKLAAARGVPCPPAEVVDTMPFLTPSERSMVVDQAETGLTVETQAAEGDVLSDRKRLLHFMRAVLADDGVAALDALAQSLWTRARLDDELQHDAPLDIIQIYVMHIVTCDEGIWAHSHGLSEIGFVDFDVIRPAEAVLEEQFDLLRSIAFAIVEQDCPNLIAPALGADPIRLMPADAFMSSASKADRELRDPDDHSDRRVICVEADAPGFFARLFGAEDTRPSRLLCRGMQEGRHLVHFSTAATELTAERARHCLPLLEALRQEFEEMECMAVVKLGYDQDGAENPDEREHLWFELHGIVDGGLDATLLNDPFRVAGMSAGMRGRHTPNRLTDWSLMTPLGQITPRTLNIARALREQRDVILKAMAEARASN